MFAGGMLDYLYEVAFDPGGRRIVAVASASPMISTH